jgi:hypothetical protein
VGRFIFGERVKRAHVSDHGALMRSLGRAWAVPMALVLSSGALITLGQTQMTALLSQYQHHQPLDYVTLALLAITFVIVGGMDLTPLNSAVELRDARLRGVGLSKDPYTRGARLRVWLVSLVESVAFMAVAYQLDRPPPVQQDVAACLMAWGFIVARALTAPVCAMYLATLGRRALVRREMYGNLLLTVGGTIQQIIENLQLAADERLIKPLWRMQVLVDRASRAQSDDEMDRFDDELLKALGELRTLRDRLRTASTTRTTSRADAARPGVPPDAAVEAGEAVVTYGHGADGDESTDMAHGGMEEPRGEELREWEMPMGRYSARRLDDRLAATR